MPATVYYDNDADPGLIADKQGRGPRLRLAGPRARAEPEGLGHRRASSACARARSRRPRPRRPGSACCRPPTRCARPTSIMVLLPDTEQKKVYEADIEPNLVDGNSLAFAHGFNIHFEPDRAARGRRRVDDRAEGSRVTSCAAPTTRAAACRASSRSTNDATGKAQADRARVRQGRSAARAPACSTPRSRRRPRPTSSVSRSCCAAGSSSSSATATRRSSKPGYQPESAYFETLHEVKLIVDLIYEGGIANDELLDLRHRRVRRDVARPAHRHADRPRPR